MTNVLDDVFESCGKWHVIENVLLFAAKILLLCECYFVVRNWVIYIFFDVTELSVSPFF